MIAKYLQHFNLYQQFINMCSNISHLINSLFEAYIFLFVWKLNFYKNVRVVFDMNMLCFVQGLL